MKFLSRFFIVLAVAVGLGFALYYAVQALPDNPPRFNPSSVRVEPGNNPNAPGDPAIRPERREGDGGRGFRLRSVIGVAGRVVLFSVLVFGAVIGKNILFGFGKKPNGIKTNNE